jgi:hypothetical protein
MNINSELRFLSQGLPNFIYLLFLSTCNLDYSFREASYAEITLE